jgi:hypothetical protein
VTQITISKELFIMTARELVVLLKCRVSKKSQLNINILQAKLRKRIYKKKPQPLVAGAW